MKYSQMLKYLKYNWLLLLLFLFAVPGSSRASNYNRACDSIPKKTKPTVSSHGKLYCSNFVNSRYRLSITTNKITIVRLDKGPAKTFHGILKNGKIYSDDADERKAKENRGRYYKLEAGNFGVLNVENGDYEWFVECKQQ